MQTLKVTPELHINLPLVTNYLQTACSPKTVKSNSALSALLSFRDGKRPNAWYEASSTMLLSRALPVAVYVILVTIQRYHLFVWSVFSPKLLYEGMHTLVIAIVVFLLLALAHFSSDK